MFRPAKSMQIRTGAHIRAAEPICEVWRVNLDEKRATNKVRNVSRREDDAGVD